MLRYVCYDCSHLVVVLPCLSHLLSLLRGHFADFGIDTTTGRPFVDHVKFVNDLGKLAASALVFLLFSAPRGWGADALLGPLGVGSAVAVRMHAAAGCLALIGATSHGTYYAIVWFRDLGAGSATWTSVFPLSGRGGGAGPCMTATATVTTTEERAGGRCATTGSWPSSE